MFSIIVCPQPILVSVINLVHHHTDKTLADPEIGQGWEVEEREISLSWLITARKRSLGQGNIFTGVCLSTGVGRGGGGEGVVLGEGSVILILSEPEKWAVRILLESFLV